MHTYKYTYKYTKPGSQNNGLCYADYTFSVGKQPWGPPTILNHFGGIKPVAFAKPG